MFLTQHGSIENVRVLPGSRSRTCEIIVPLTVGAAVEPEFTVEEEGPVDRGPRVEHPSSPCGRRRRLTCSNPGPLGCTARPLRATSLRCSVAFPSGSRNRPRSSVNPRSDFGAYLRRPILKRAAIGSPPGARSGRAERAVDPVEFGRLFQDVVVESRRSCEGVILAMMSDVNLELSG